MAAGAADPETTKPNGRRTLVSDDVVRHITEKVMTGQLISGQALGSEVEMSAEFGVSRAPIRDALRRLQAMGLVDIRVGAGGGAFISEAAPDQAVIALDVQAKLMGIDIADLFAVRRALQSYAIGLLAPVITDEQLEECERMLLAIDAEDDNDQAIRLTHAFQLRLIEMTRLRLTHLIMQSMARIFFDQFRPVNDRERIRFVAEHLRGITLHLSRRDAPAASSAMLAYLADVEYRFEARL